jgi:NADPH2:quinone reductase
VAGRHLVVGFAAGSIPSLPVNLSLLKGAALVRVDLARFSFMHEPEVASEYMQQLLSLVRERQADAHIGHVYPFAQAREALAGILARRTIGKAACRSRLTSLVAS